jgi:hypothetical protein
MTADRISRIGRAAKPDRGFWCLAEFYSLNEVFSCFGFVFYRPPSSTTRLGDVSYPGYPLNFVQGVGTVGRGSSSPASKGAVNVSNIHALRSRFTGSWRGERDFTLPESLSTICRTKYKTSSITLPYSAGRPLRSGAGAGVD